MTKTSWVVSLSLCYKNWQNLGQTTVFSIILEKNKTEQRFRKVEKSRSWVMWMSEVQTKHRCRTTPMKLERKSPTQDGQNGASGGILKHKLCRAFHFLWPKGQCRLVQWARHFLGLDFSLFHTFLLTFHRLQIQKPYVYWNASARC